MIISYPYILCYGSTIIRKFIFDLRNNFNTSYVTVQPLNILPKMMTKKYFNTSYVTVQLLLIAVGLSIFTSFQYILCYGSTRSPLHNIPDSKYFNTSYVTVQLFWSLELVLDYRNFNTSYVTVQRYS